MQYKVRSEIRICFRLNDANKGIAKIPTLKANKLIAVVATDSRKKAWSLDVEKRYTCGILRQKQHSDRINPKKGKNKKGIERKMKLKT
jgi:hypothetical protein